MTGKQDLEVTERLTDRGVIRAVGGTSTGLDIDRYRAIVFPNHIRSLRKQHGYAKLLGLSSLLPDIPYIRLSKIERGEVFAKASEIIRIAQALSVEPDQLIIDIDASDFDIAEWAQNLQDWVAIDPAQDMVAVLLAAAMRAKRENDKRLTIATLELDYGIAPVILSRIENAYKTIDRWNAATIRSLCSIFGVEDETSLRAHMSDLYKEGALNAHLNHIANSTLRITKTRTKVAALRREIAEGDPTQRSAKTAHALKILLPRTLGQGNISHASHIASRDSAIINLVPVFGSPLPDGLIAHIPLDDRVEAPRSAGPNSYGLKVCRATLGAGLPASATVIVDPDRFPSHGGLAVIREPAGHRLVMVTFDRNGAMMGYSTHPDREIEMDIIPPTEIAAVIGAVYE